MRPTPHLDAVKAQLSEAVDACAELGMAFAAQTITLIRARRERDGLRRALADATRLLEFAMHLRSYGERAPGGSETWQEFDRAAEVFLRSLGGLKVSSGALFGRDAGPEWEHEESCSWPEKGCTGHISGYQRVRVPENTGQYPTPDEKLGSK